MRTHLSRRSYPPFTGLGTGITASHFAPCDPNPTVRTQKVLGNAPHATQERSTPAGTPVERLRPQLRYNDGSVFCDVARLVSVVNRGRTSSVVDTVTTGSTSGTSEPRT